MVIKNVNQITKAIEPYIINALQEVANNVKQKLIDTVNDRMYEAWTPDRYSRTLELLNSISTTNVAKVYGRYIVKIYYDTTKIHPYMVDGQWNKHADFYGNDVSEYIPLWIEYGTENNKHYEHDGISAIEDVFEWISTEYNRLFASALKTTGMNSVSK